MDKTKIELRAQLMRLCADCHHGDKYFGSDLAEAVAPAISQIIGASMNAVLRSGKFELSSVMDVACFAALEMGYALAVEHATDPNGSFLERRPFDAKASA